ncbi:tRNA pseudouridine(38-40) synthase TruA [bacterium]|nr:tRNA pseudouridine(38-40) synthase TruA [bacterium]
MENIRITLAYNGTNYHGWQIQPNGITVQSVMEETLRRLFKKEIKVIGQGRTDTGVHAIGQVASFKVPAIALKNMKISQIKDALNSVLPQDIAVTDVESVSLDFHPRFDAKQRIYRYVVCNDHNKHVFGQMDFYSYPYKLNLSMMREGAKYLIGRHDFSSFQCKKTDNENPVRTIKKISISRTDFNVSNFLKLRRKAVIFEIAANAFLYNMVRIIVGTLLDVGRRRIEPQNIKKVLAGRDRNLAGETVPACGLCLIAVHY